MYVSYNVERYGDYLWIAEKCATALDVVLVLDQSASIVEEPGGHENWDVHVRGFAKSIAGALRIGRNLTQIGLMKFSDVIEISFHLNTYDDLQSLLNATDHVDIDGGQTNIAAALRTARQIMFTAQNGARPGVPKVIILMADGTANTETDNTLPEANLTKAANIKIYTVGVGYDVNDEQLRSIASVPECFFFAPNFTRLDSIVQQIVENLCNETAATTTTTTTAATTTPVTISTSTATTTNASVTTTAQLIGPLYTDVTYLGVGPFTDFYFICRVGYQQSDQEMSFEVAVTFDGRVSNVTKTATSSSSSSSLDIRFTSQDVSAGFGTQVSYVCVLYSDSNIVLHLAKSD